jgi:hypothetical protein
MSLKFQGTPIKAGSRKLGFVTIHDLMDAVRKGHLKFDPNNRGATKYSTAHINNIINNFDVNKLSAFQVEERSNGDMIIIDGHNRIKALNVVYNLIQQAAQHPRTTANYQVPIYIVPQAVAFTHYVACKSQRPDNVASKITHPHYLLGDVVVNKLQAPTGIKFKSPAMWLSVLDIMFAMETTNGVPTIQDMNTARRQVNKYVNVALSSGTPLPLSKHTIAKMVSGLQFVKQYYDSIPKNSPKTTNNKICTGPWNKLESSTGLLQMLLLDKVSEASSSTFSSLSAGALAIKTVGNADKIIKVAKDIAQKNSDTGKSLVKFLVAVGANKKVAEHKKWQL